MKKGEKFYLFTSSLLSLLCSLLGTYLVSIYLNKNISSGATTKDFLFLLFLFILFTGLEIVCFFIFKKKYKEVRSPLLCIPLTLFMLFNISLFLVMIQ